MMKEKDSMVRKSLFKENIAAKEYEDFVDRRGKRNMF